MSEQFAENAYDPTEALSAEDRLVLNKYEKSIVNNGNRYQIGLHFTIQRKRRQTSKQLYEYFESLSETKTKV